MQSIESEISGVLSHVEHWCPRKAVTKRICVELLWMYLNRERDYPISKDHSCRLESDSVQT